jgi:hypothetical protein
MRKVLIGLVLKTYRIKESLSQDRYRWKQKSFSRRYGKTNP